MILRAHNSSDVSRHSENFKLDRINAMIGKLLVLLEFLHRLFKMCILWVFSLLDFICPFRTFLRTTSLL